SHEIPDNCFQPRVFAHTKKNAWPLANLQFVNRGTSQQVTKCLHTLHHFLAQLFLRNPLHGTGDKLQVRVESDVKFDLVPDVGEERPRIVINDLVEHFLIWKLDDATAGVITRHVLTAEFPKSGIEVTNINYVAGGIGYLDTIAYSVRLTNKNIDPAYETFH